MNPAPGPKHLDRKARGVAVHCAIYEYAAECIGETPFRVSRDADLLARAHSEAHRRFRHDPVVVGIDLYHPEAEAYGAAVCDAGGMTLPTQQPVGLTLDQISSLPPIKPRNAGRLPLLLDAAYRVRTSYPKAKVFVPVTGPWSLAAQIIGIEELLIGCAVEPEAAVRAITHLLIGQRRWVRTIGEAGLDVAVVESAASPPLVPPEWFRRIVLPSLDALLGEALRACGRPAMLIQGGDTARLVESMARLPVSHLLCPAETDQAAFVAAMAGRPEVTVRVNMRAGVIASPDQHAMRRELDRVAALARAHPAGAIGTGVIPCGTPPENIRAAQAYAADA